MPPTAPKIYSSLASRYLAGIAGKYDILLGYENGGWTVPALLNPGGGYWIHMTQPGTVQ